uniref:Uncharacterized protein n=1 Tax=Clytia hemisphaerica TaxID=252671 RepID=A0A7M5V093_9CNID
MRMSSSDHTCQLQAKNDKNNNNIVVEEVESRLCAMCVHTKSLDEGDSMLRVRRRSKGGKQLDRALTINIPCLTEKPPKVKRASSSVIRRSPNNKVLYRTLTPSCCPDSRKPLSCRPPTPFFNEETQSKRRSKQFSFEDEVEDDVESENDCEDTKL